MVSANNELHEFMGQSYAHNNIQVKIIEDSCSGVKVTMGVQQLQNRIVTFQLRYPRFIHSELMTHRGFSRNASSSRAIPLAKMINQVMTNPAIPIHFGKNQSGMQAKVELEGEDRAQAQLTWLEASREAVRMVERLKEIGTHKQVANRLLEPFQYIEVVLTTTMKCLNNFFELRDHKDAQPEIALLAQKMKEALVKSEPNVIALGEWHIPYVSKEERQLYRTEILLNISVARCCRVSYLRHDNEAPSVKADLELCEKLAGSKPGHYSPFEHQAQYVDDYIQNSSNKPFVLPNIFKSANVKNPPSNIKVRLGNLDKFQQYRHIVENYGLNGYKFN